MKKAEVKNNLAVFFDLGDEAVTASVIAPTSHDGKPIIIWHETVPITSTSTLDPKAKLLKTLTALEEAAFALHRTWPNLTNEAECILPKPFYHHATKTVILEEDEPFNLDEEVFHQLREREISDYLLQVKKPYQDIPQDVPVMLEYRLLHLLVNDREATLPHYEPVNNLELGLYLSAGSEAITNRLKKIIIGHGHFDRVNFHSDYFATTALMRELTRQGRGLNGRYELSPLAKSLPYHYPVPHALFIAGVASDRAGLL